MADLATLLARLKQLEENSDFDGLRAVRQEIINEYESSEKAAEALYKLGLDSLFRRRNMADASSSFERAAKLKHSFWSEAARTSLGICLYHHGKKQQSLFQLRRVGYADKPTDHSVTALAFIETIFTKEDNLVEVSRVRKTRILQLKKIIDSTKPHGDPAALGHYLYCLGVALMDEGLLEEATPVLVEAKELGADILGADLYRAVAAIV